MILKGSQRSGGRQLAFHLLNQRDNDKVTVHDMRGFMSDDLVLAFNEIHAISQGTRCKQFLFSLSLNPPATEDVPVEVFEGAVERIEHKLGLANQPRAFVFHEKKGRRHAHAIWSRIDVEQMKAINLPHFKNRLNDIGRDFYQENDWKMPRGFLNRTESAPNNYLLYRRGCLRANSTLVADTFTRNQKGMVTRSRS